MSKSTLAVIISAAMFSVSLGFIIYYFPFGVRVTNVVHMPKDYAELNIMLNHFGPPHTTLKEIHAAEKSWDGKCPQVRIVRPDGSVQEMTFEELKRIRK